VILAVTTYEAGLLVELNSLSALKWIFDGVTDAGSIVLDLAVVDS
jgi:hypothetical protein